MNPERIPNRLIHATSPYLLQHAYNPVDWHEWNKEALDKAKKEDKPILVSIGYSSCHWCHVMERESFEKDEIAEVMNSHFVCIKVDREERPDIDQIYMDAVQALGGNGGWPLNVFLTPDQKPFFGGTYFSPPGWVQILTNINKAFQGNRGPIEDTAEQLRTHLMRSDVERFRKPAEKTELKNDLTSIYKKFENVFDTVWGGLDKAPKFVMPSIWMWLLRYYKITKNELALEQITLTLKRIGMGGIYDQIGGGFARYSVDGQWFAPHFEKMLYDNAQLISLYSEAYTISRDPEFKTIVYETVAWLQREMTAAHGGFYSAIDADSEGVEGKFYTWTSQELDNVLGTEAKIIREYYSVAENGNWEHGNNILIRSRDDKTFLEGKKMSTDEWNTLLASIKGKLLYVRGKRIRPSLDDKIITSWNALMVCGLLDAFKAFSDDSFLQLALRALNFLETELIADGILFRSFKNKRSAVHAFLDDYAWLIHAQIKSYEVTFDEDWLRKAEKNMSAAVTLFHDQTDGYFHYAAQHAEKLIAAKKEIFDNVIPSSNAIMAQNLFRLGIILGNEQWKQMGTTMVESFGSLIQSEPNYMSQWAIAFTEIRNGLAEVVFAGEGRREMRSNFHQHFQPFTIAFGKEHGSTLEITKGKAAPDDHATVYVCYDMSCKQPVHTTEEAIAELNRPYS